MVKTTLYLDAENYRKLRQIARTRGTATARLVREAVEEYALRHAVARRPKSLGAFRSRKGTLSERAEDLLTGMGRSR